MKLTSTDSTTETEPFDLRATLELRHLETASRYPLTNLLPLPLVVIGLSVLLGLWHEARPIVVWAATTIATWSVTIYLLNKFLHDEKWRERVASWRIAICGHFRFRGHLRCGGSGFLGRQRPAQQCPALMF
jgi:hypothetical protein